MCEEIVSFLFMDKAALTRVYPTSLIVSFFVASIFLANTTYDWPIGIVIGTLVGLLIFKSTEVMVYRVATKSKKSYVWGFLGLKYLAIGALFYLLLKTSFFNVFAFIIGFLIVQIVIILKTIGHSLFVSSE